MSDYHILVGDCIEQMRTLPDHCVDLVLTDPPYGTTACKWDTIIPFEPMWAEVRRVLHPNRVAIFTASQPFTSALVMSNAAEHHQTLVWRKNKASGHLNAKRRHLTAHEDVVIFAKGIAPYNPQMWQSRPSNSARRSRFSPIYGSQVPTTYQGGKTDRYPVSVVDFDVVNNDGSNGGRFHPTQKPVDLLAYLIRTYSDPGQVVLDFTMGSGSTGVACVETGRQFIGIERDQAFFQIAEDRLKAASIVGPLFARAAE